MWLWLSPHRPALAHGRRTWTGVWLDLTLAARFSLAGATTRLLLSLCRPALACSPTARATTCLGLWVRLHPADPRSRSPTWLGLSPPADPHSRPRRPHLHSGRHHGSLSPCRPCGCDSHPAHRARTHATAPSHGIIWMWLAPALTPCARADCARTLTTTQRTTQRTPPPPPRAVREPTQATAVRAQHRHRRHTWRASCTGTQGKAAARRAR